MSLSKTLYPLLSTGLTQEDRETSGHYLKIVDWNIMHQHESNQNNSEKSHDMRFPTMWYVRPAKAQTS